MRDKGEGFQYRGQPGGEPVAIIFYHLNCMRETFFGKKYDVPQGMSSVEFNKKISNWSKKESSMNAESSPEKLDAIEMLLETKKIIDGISLEPDFSSEENKKELEKRKEIAIKLLVTTHHLQPHDTITS